MSNVNNYIPTFHKNSRNTHLPTQINPKLNLQMSYKSCPDVRKKQ